MAILSVAIKADPTAVLPAVLAAAFADPAINVAVDYKDVASLGEPVKEVEALTEDGDRFANSAALPWFNHVTQGSVNPDKQGKVCSL